MVVFVLAHFTEFYETLVGISGVETGGKILVDAGIFLFQRDGQCEDFLFGKTVERFHKKGANNRAIASRSFPNANRLSTWASVTSWAEASFLRINFLASSANSCP